MSYSSRTKEELCRFEPESVCCRLAELSGIVTAAGSVVYRGGGEKRLSIETENQVVAARTAGLLQTVFEIQPSVVTRHHARLGGRDSYRILIGPQDAPFVLEGCGIEMALRRSVPKEITARKCCRKSFLRGVFLASGSVTDPDKGYHMELVFADEAFAQSVKKLMTRFDLAASLTWRRSQPMLYLKGQTDITDMLSLIGASTARFAMEDSYIRKALRNDANRAANCDSANVQRTVEAAERQLSAIRLVLEKGMASLEPKLLEAAKLRIENPEMSLEELGQLCEPPVGKSGVHHRLRKLTQMAAALEQAPETPDAS